MCNLHCVNFYLRHIGISLNNTNNYREKNRDLITIRNNYDLSYKTRGS